MPPCPGNLDVLTAVNGRVDVHGWMFQPGRQLERIEAFLDGTSVGRVSTVDRSDVAAAFEWATDARPSAFALEHTIAGGSPARVDLVGWVGDIAAARLICFFPAAADARAPLPPESLQERVAGFHGRAFRAQGLRMFAGVVDSALDPALDGIAPPGYYRGVFQSRAHTLDVCSRRFAVVDYVERGLNGHQDLVILRRPAS